MANPVYTIGHSTHPLERLIDLLRKHQVTAVCDVRSTPYSRMNPQFNREELKQQLRLHDIAYVFLGKELGARSDDPSCYVGGKVQYSRLARTESFRSGLCRIQDGRKKYQVALMCAEKEPLDCHRTILVGRALEEDLNIPVSHIHANGVLERHSDAMLRLAQMFNLRAHEEHMFCTNDAVLEEAYSLQEERIAYTVSHAETRAARSSTR
jgi:uncharacterized protein (DUF488 family)